MPCLFAGLPAYDGTVNVFATAGHLLRVPDSDPIAIAFGIPVDAVHSWDWMEELLDDRSNGDWRESASIAVVHTLENHKQLHRRRPRSAE